jgi:hypothetical protein
LDQAKQFDLALRRQGIDLIQKKSSALGGCHEALALRAGSRKCATYVAEKFVFEEQVGNRAAVDRDKGGSCALALPVNVTGVPLFADACGTCDEYFRIGGCEFGEPFEQGAMDRTLTDQFRGCRHGFPPQVCAARGKAAASVLRDTKTVRWMIRRW